MPLFPVNIWQATAVKTRNNIYVVAVVVFQTHVLRLFAWDVSYISNIFIELLPPPDGVLRQQPMPYTL
jgi:hypothetical protein